MVEVLFNGVLLCLFSQLWVQEFHINNKIAHGKSIYSTEISKHYKPDFGLLFLII